MLHEESRSKESSREVDGRTTWMGYSIDRTKVDQWGFNLTWQGRERASSICVRSKTARNYVESRTERQFVEECVDECEEDIRGRGGGGGEGKEEKEAELASRLPGTGASCHPRAWTASISGVSSR